MTSPKVLAPTLLEYAAVLRFIPYSDAIWAGVKLSRWREKPQTAPLLVCGVAGGLSRELQPGTVLIPEHVGLPDGRLFTCDQALVSTLQAAAAKLRLPLDYRPLLTAETMVVGSARELWAARGFVAADMEVGRVAARGLRVASVRVVLDAVEKEISPEWDKALGALRRPEAWKELLWLARMAPCYALRAAQVVKAGLALLQERGPT